MTQTDTIRRQPNGSIDLDFYRSGATALRRQALREARMLRHAGVGALAMIGTTAVAIMLLATPAAPPSSTVTVAQATASPAR